MPASGASFYQSGNVIVTLNQYTWHAPAAVPGDVCEQEVFSPGDGNDFFGSFTVQAWPAATLTVSPATNSPEKALLFAGTGFIAGEQIEVYSDLVLSAPLAAAAARPNGSFSAVALERQLTNGSHAYFAVGETGGALGAATSFVAPRLLISPATGVPGGTASIQAVGFGADEQIDIYWNAPRVLLGSAATNNKGSVTGAHADSITIPATAARGANTVLAVGQTSQAIGIGTFTVE